MNIKTFFLLSIIACSWNVWAIPGDLNGDGILDIADLVRINAMISYKTEKTPEADLNFDGQVDATDHEMLLAAIQNLAPLPTKVECTRQWYAGIVSGNGFAVNLPYAQSNLLEKVSVSSFDTLPNPPSKSLTYITKPLVFHNIPRNHNDPEIHLDLPANAATPALLVGKYIAARGDSAPTWQYHVLTLDDPEAGLTLENGKLIWHPRVCTYSQQTEVPLSLTVINGAPKTRGTPDEEIGFQQCGSGDGYVKYKTNHFVIMDLNLKPTTAKYLAILLEIGYNIMGQMGFNQNFSSKWGNTYINVTILSKDAVVSNMHHACVPPTLYGPPTLRINPLDLEKNNSDIADTEISDDKLKQLIDEAKKNANIVSTSDFQQRTIKCLEEHLINLHSHLSSTLALSIVSSSVTCGLAYYHFYCYKDALSVEWLEEMCAAVCDLYVSYFCDAMGVLKAFGVTAFPTLWCMPFGAAFHGIAIPENASSILDNMSAAAGHGWGLLPFISWMLAELDNDVHENHVRFLSNIFSSNGYRINNGVQALMDALRASGAPKSLSEYYSTYIRECFTYGENAGTFYMKKPALQTAINIMKRIEAGELPTAEEDFDDYNRPWILMERMFDLQQADVFTPTTAHWKEEIGIDDPPFSATYSFQIQDMSTATFLLDFKNLASYFDFEKQQYEYSDIYVFASNVKDMDIFACHHDIKAQHVQGKVPGWLTSAPEDVVWDEKKENCMLTIPADKIQDKFGICVVKPNALNDGNNPLGLNTRQIELSVGFSGPLIIKNTNVTATWDIDTHAKVNPPACEMHTEKLSLTPLENTIFIGASSNIEQLMTNFSYNNGEVGIGIPKAGPPKDLKFNLTGVVSNIPHGAVEWIGYDGITVKMEFTGEYQLTVAKNVNNDLVYIPFETNGIGTPFVDGNMKGIVLAAADFAPREGGVLPPPPGSSIEPVKQLIASLLNVTIPDYDAEAPYYQVSLAANYKYTEMKGERIYSTGTISRFFTTIRLSPLNMLQK